MRDTRTAFVLFAPAFALLGFVLFSPVVYAILRCQRLVKGYGDTHERGLRNFERLMAAARQLAGRADALAELRSADEADEQGQVLAAALQRLDLA